MIVTQITFKEEIINCWKVTNQVLVNYLNSQILLQFIIIIFFNRYIMQELHVICTEDMQIFNRLIEYKIAIIIDGLFKEINYS